jgi:hypothetical protein
MRNDDDDVRQCTCKRSLDGSFWPSWYHDRGVLNDRIFSTMPISVVRRSYTKG